MRNYQYLYLDHTESQVNFYKNISKFISNDISTYKDEYQQKTCIKQYNPYTNSIWYPSHIYYFTEEILSKKLIKIGNYPNGFSPIYPCQTLYLLCENDLSNQCFQTSSILKPRKLNDFTTDNNQKYSLYVGEYIETVQ